MPDTISSDVLLCIYTYIYVYIFFFLILLSILCES